MTLNTQTQANNDNASFDARRFGCAPWGAARYGKGTAMPALQVGPSIHTMSGQTGSTGGGRRVTLVGAGLVD